jgi:hypothetical protein
VAISFVGSKAFALTAIGGSTSVSLTDLKTTSGVNASLAAGDLIIVAYSQGDANDVNPPTPTGYDEDVDISSSDSFGFANLLVWKKFMPATPDATVSLPNKASAGPAVCGTIYALRGVDINNPYDVAVVTATGQNTDRANPGSVTPATAGSWIMGIGAGVCFAGGAINLTNPGDWSSTTNHFKNNFDWTGTSQSCQVATGIKTDWASGAFDAAAFTGGNNTSSSAWAAATLVFRTSVGVAPFKGRLTFTGKVPSVLQTPIQPIKGRLTLTGKVPSVFKGVLLAPAPGRLTFTGYPPTVATAAPTNSGWSIFIPTGTVGTSQSARSRRFRGFAPSQSFYLSFYYKADRTTGSEPLALKARVNWFGATGPLAPTEHDITIDADIVDYTFAERQHTAPAGALEGEVEFLATPTSSPMQHDVWVTGIRLGLTERSADVTSSISGAADISLPCSSAGVLNGSSPYATEQYKLYENGAQVSAGVTWAVVSATTGVSVSITGTSIGVLTVTGMTVNSGDVVISAARAGKAARQFTLKVSKSNAPPAAGGAGGGTSASQTSGFTGALSGTAATISADLDMTGGTSGNVTLAASLSNDPGASGSGAWNDRGQWYRWNGAAYVAIGSTMDFTTATSETVAGHYDGEGYWEAGYSVSEAGSVSNSQTYAGVASGANKFRYYAWHLGTSTNTTRAMTFSGTISATAA